jgi:brassinosteroid-6-oxidase 1
MILESLPIICWILQKEHLDIRKGKAPEDALDWNDYKSMTFTRAVSRAGDIKAVTVDRQYAHDKLIDSSVIMQVIYETLRLATVVNGLLRKTTQDVEMNGENYIMQKYSLVQYIHLAIINVSPVYKLQLLMCNITFFRSGYVIPKGWRIYVYTREINYDPFLYSEPIVFNPWRWMVRNTATSTTSD